MGLRDRFIQSPIPVKLATQEVTTEFPELSEWLQGSTLFIRELDGEQRTVMESEQGDMTVDEDGKPTLKLNSNSTRSSRIVCWCLIDEKGQRIFADEDEIIVAKKLPGRTLNQLGKLIIGLSGIKRADKEKLEKNSGKVAGAGFSSGSPVTLAGAVSNGDLPISAVGS